MIFEVFSNWLLVSTSGKVLLMFFTLKKWKWIGMLLSNWALNSSRCWWGLLGTQKSTPQWFGMRIMRWCNSFCSNMSWTLGPHPPLLFLHFPTYMRIGFSYLSFFSLLLLFPTCKIYTRTSILYSQCGHGTTFFERTWLNQSVWSISILNF